MAPGSWLGGVGDITKESFRRPPESRVGRALKAAALHALWIQTITYSEGFFFLSLLITMLIKLLFQSPFIT